MKLNYDNLYGPSKNLKIFVFIQTLVISEKSTASEEHTIVAT